VSDRVQKDATNKIRAYVSHWITWMVDVSNTFFCKGVLCTLYSYIHTLHW
jgi:hypothetical protein